MSPGRPSRRDIDGSTTPTSTSPPQAHSYFLLVTTFSVKIRLMEDGTVKSVTHIDVCDTTSCEIRDLLDRLADKWSLLVIELLGNGSQRFTDLHREIDDISQRMLTLTLRHLERDGLVTRTVHPVVPPRVDYTLTDLGRSLLVAIEGLVRWTRAHRDEIPAARSGYDARRESSAGGSPASPAAASGSSSVSLSVSL